MAAYKSKAISLKTKPFAEADKLVTLFTRDHGKIRAIAKGARRVPSRFGGRVEPFTYSDCFIAKGRNLDIREVGRELSADQFFQYVVAQSPVAGS